MLARWPGWFLANEGFVQAWFVGAGLKKQSFPRYFCAPRQGKGGRNVHQEEVDTNSAYSLSSLSDRGGRCPSRHGFARFDFCSFPMALDFPRNLRTRRGLRYRLGRVIIRGPFTTLLGDDGGAFVQLYKIRYCRDHSCRTWRPLRWLMVVVGELLE